jgi:hypothetical protein
MVNFIAQKKITYPIWIEDAKGASTSIGKSIIDVSSGYPTNAIINGTTAIDHEQWEVLYKEAGFTESYIDTYKSIIDAVYPTNKPILSIQANQQVFAPGDSLTASLRLQYYGPNSSFDYYTALSAFGNLFFYPNWTTTPASNTLIVSSGYDATLKLLDGIPISNNIPEGTYSLLAIAANTGTLNPITPLIQQNFTIKYDAHSGIETYFKNNPVYMNIGDKRYHFTIYLENTGNIDIKIDTCIIYYFDAQGNALGDPQDASSDFATWFNLTDGVLLAGYKAEVKTLSIGAGTTPVEKGAEFYFSGYDQRNRKVEVRSERLNMKILTPGE